MESAPRFDPKIISNIVLAPKARRQNAVKALTSAVRISLYAWAISGLLVAVAWLVVSGSFEPLPALWRYMIGLM